MKMWLWWEILEDYYCIGFWLVSGARHRTARNIIFAWEKKCLVKNGRPLGVLILELESEVFFF